MEVRRRMGNGGAGLGVGCGGVLVGWRWDRKRACGTTERVGSCALLGILLSACQGRYRRVTEANYWYALLNPLSVVDN